MLKVSVLICFIFSIQVFGANSIIGHWEGVITHQGKEWRTWLDVKSVDAKFTSTIDFPDFGLYALPANMTIENEKVKIGTIAGNSVASFDGVLRDQNLSGEWKGLNITATFSLKRLNSKPLDPYLEEEVTFQNGNANLVGTLIKPNKSGKHPAIIFTHGSGNQTRTQSSYRSRAYLFARHGIASLIYDRRGTGASKGGGDNANWNNLADDAIAGLKMLQNRADINPKQIGVSGFSQGGWVSPLAALRSKDVAFVLVGSAAAITPEQQNNYNVESLLRDRGVSEETIKSVMNLRLRVDKFLHNPNGDKMDLENEIAKLKGETWFRNALLSEKLEPYDVESKKYITFDPAPIWEKIIVPVCSLWGEKDSNVPSQKSNEIMENALKRARNKKYLLKIFPKSGHGVGIVREKNEAWDFPRLAPGYQETMVEWVQKQVKIVRK